MTQSKPITLPWTGPRIAVLEISGAIGQQVRGLDLTRTIRGLTNDPRVKAVVGQIDYRLINLIREVVGIPVDIFGRKNNVD